MRIIKLTLKKILSKKIKFRISSLLQIPGIIRPIAKRECNICKFKGFFLSFGKPDVQCPICGSFQRQRLLILAIKNTKIRKFKNSKSSVLHFAPEKTTEPLLRKKFLNYLTADLLPKAEIVIDIENIKIKKKFDIIIANHVFEHVNDKKAAKELSSILKINGVLVCQVPIIEGWDKTYENKLITTDSQKKIHFGQEDHLRFYGKDFRKRISAGGFKLINEFTAEGKDVVKYSLIHGEKVFFFQKL